MVSCEHVHKDHDGLCEDCYWYKKEIAKRSMEDYIDEAYDRMKDEQAERQYEAEVEKSISKLARTGSCRDVMKK